ncbi:hypothetical protein [Sphingomonas sp. CLY1604]|uniref:hypothetical protein n=1 Tax=Sphingomonas sp. CLY1604 TaxID=3457786 RepID=UPI003FD8CBE5
MRDVAIIVIGLVAALAAGAIVRGVYLRHRARRSARWHRRYFHEGGLIRVLMSRWSSQPKLTYRRPDDAAASARSER